MPRGASTLAKQILKDVDESDEKGPFLVLYDFRERASNIFYKNLAEIQETLQDGERIQKSVIQCEKMRTVRAIERLAGHYEADVLLFQVKQIERA